MKRAFIGVLSFCISLAIAYQFIVISASPIPVHGEAFVGDQIINALIYFIIYLSACLFFAIKYSSRHKTKYIICLLLFFGMTALIGFTINKYLFGVYADRLSNGIWYGE
jgi:hypothetical protein